MIAQYESETDNALLKAPRQYGLTQNHKHLKEMKAICGLDVYPVFCRSSRNFYSGMEVTVPLCMSDLKQGTSVEDIISVYKNKYTGPVVSYSDSCDEGGMLSAADMSLKDSMIVSVFGNEERVLLTARYDNLGRVLPAQPLSFLT